MLELDYRRVLDAFADAVVACDATGHFVYVNAAAERLLGWPASELCGQALTVIIPARLHAVHQAGFNHYVATQRSKLIGQRIRVPALRRDGTEIDVELALTALRGGDGPEVIVASLRDLSARVELERQIAVSRYLQATTAASAKLGSWLNLEHILSTVVETLVADFDGALARIWLYDAASDTLHLRASAGLSRQTTQSSRARLQLATYPYKVGEVARTLKPFVRNGLAGDPQFEQDWVRQEKIAAVACFPLLIEGKLQGVLVHFTRQPLAEEMVEALATFVAIVTASLHDVQLFQKEQQARAEAEEAQRRAAFLAEASTALAASLDFPTTLANVTRLAVPHLADWCAVHTLEADGCIRQLAVAHVDPKKVEFARELEQRYPPDPKAPFGVPQVLRSGRAEILSEVPESVLQAYARDAEHLRLLHELGLQSYMIVPMVARGRTLGTIAFASAESSRRYGPDDLALAEDLAYRAAVAVDNAQLYREAQDAVKVRDHFLSIASHELRTPLSPVHLQIQVLLRAVRAGTLDKMPHGRLLNTLEICDRQIKQLVRLISDLLDVSRIAAGRLDLRWEDVDLSSLVGDVVARFSAEAALAGCPVQVHAQTAVLGRWDRLRLEQVVTNLLSNAVKYGPGQPIDITVEAAENLARLKVRDQGMGIAPEHQARIFQRFERAVSGHSYGGLGLGLFIVHQIVLALGGSIWVQSEVGKGSTFTVELPRHSSYRAERGSVIKLL